jgi:hypothetical protein
LHQVFETRVGLFGRAEAGELAHRPEFAAITGWVNASRVGKLAGERNVPLDVDVLNVGGSVEPIDFFQRDCLKALFTFGMFG